MLFILLLIVCWFSTPALIKFFAKIKKLRPIKKEDVTMLKWLHFKNNQAAFEYACQYLSVSPEIPLVAIVVEENNGKFCLKIANSKDPHIPVKSVKELIELKQIDYLCLTARKVEEVPPLKKGDLVMWQSIVPSPQPYLAGLILAKISPSYNFIENCWAEAV
ncbi:hypothetical protein [Legionella bozemanae]|uniref:hypothetical protein n=1 Tax=Legionella bozemanae TaxID=447 RepID=UPI00399CF007